MNMNNLLRITVALLISATISAIAADKKIVLIAGSPSHGIGGHEYRARCLLLQKFLPSVPGINAVVFINEWAADPNAFDGADAVFIFSTGGGGHPAAKPERLKVLGDLMKKGVGFGRSEERRVG